jgi:hypothetical protein
MDRLVGHLHGLFGAVVERLTGAQGAERLGVGVGQADRPVDQQRQGDGRTLDKDQVGVDIGRLIGELEQPPQIEDRDSLPLQVEKTVQLGRRPRWPRQQGQGDDTTDGTRVDREQQVRQLEHEQRPRPLPGQPHVSMLPGRAFHRRILLKQPPARGPGYRSHLTGSCQTSAAPTPTAPPQRPGKALAPTAGGSYRMGRCPDGSFP